MRKTYIFILLFFVLAICGCTAKDDQYVKDQNAVTDSYSGNILIVDKDKTNYTGEISYYTVYKKISYDPQFKDNIVLDHDINKIYQTKDVSVYYNVEVNHTYHVEFNNTGQPFMSINGRYPTILSEVK